MLGVENLLCRCCCQRDPERSAYLWGANHGAREENRSKIAQRSESHEKNPTLSDQVVSEELVEALSGGGQPGQGRAGAAGCARAEPGSSQMCWERWEERLHQN